MSPVYEIKVNFDCPNHRLLCVVAIHWIRISVNCVVVFLPKGKMTDGVYFRAVDRSADGQAYGTLHYFFDAVFPFLEVGYVASVLRHRHQV